MLTTEQRDGAQAPSLFRARHSSGRRVLGEIGAQLYSFESLAVGSWQNSSMNSRKRPNFGWPALSARRVGGLSGKLVVNTVRSELRTSCR